MKYGIYEVTEEKSAIIIDNINDFNPVHTFDCGQCFRWVRDGEGGYTGIVRGKAANISIREGRLVIKGASLNDFEKVWYDYLDLGRDYRTVKQTLSKDPNVKTAIVSGGGIRLLKQELWETLISFIISANNQIPRIMKIVASISESYGDEIEFEDKRYFSFPDPERLAGSSLERLNECRGGFRCKYIHETARKVSRGEFDLERLADLSTDDAREMLKELPGVGDKVADCTLLYSGLKYDVFPTDVWVKRVMEELYFRRNASFKEIRQFSESSFGSLAGFAQQYLFYYARENRIGAMKKQE